MADPTTQQVAAELRAVITRLEQERAAAFQRLADLAVDNAVLRLENKGLRKHGLELQLELAQSTRLLAAHNAALTHVAIRDAFRRRGL